MKPSLDVQVDVLERSKAEPNDTRVADQIVQVLLQKKIDRVFGIPGGTISPIYDALYDSDIEIVSCQHESMAVYMACGYARATGRPAVVAVTSGPGVLNALTGISAAYLDEMPILILAGEASKQSFGRSPLQEGSPAGLDILNLFRSVTRYRETLWHPERVGAMMEQAFHVIDRCPRGPALLQLPVDVLQRTVPVAGSFFASQEAKLVDPDGCAAAASKLHHARAPALLLGMGARAPGVRDVVVELAEALHCGVITDAEGKGVFPESHPLSLGIFGVGGFGGAQNYLDNHCDALLTIGARLDDTTTGGYSSSLRLGSGGSLMQLDHDMSRMSRSYMTDLMVCGDILGSVKQILDRLPNPSAELFLSRDAAVQKARSTRYPRSIHALDVVPFDPRVVPRLLQEFWRDSVFTSDIGNHLLFALQNLVVDQEDGFHVAFGLAGMGGGIGTAMGLQMGYGSDRQVVSICGDGGILMVGNELATCVQQGIPLVCAVFNDGSLGMVQHGFATVYGREVKWNTPATDLVAYARSLGAEAVRIEGVGDFARAARSSGRGPLVLDIPIDGTVRAPNPRDTVCNFPKGAT